MAIIFQILWKFLLLKVLSFYYLHIFMFFNCRPSCSPLFKSTRMNFFRILWILGSWNRVELFKSTLVLDSYVNDISKIPQMINFVLSFVMRAKMAEVSDSMKSLLDNSFEYKNDKYLVTKLFSVDQLKEMLTKKLVLDMLPWSENPLWN